MEELREDVPQMPLDLDQLFPAGYMIGLGGSMYYQEHRDGRILCCKAAGAKRFRKKEDAEWFARRHLGYAGMEVSLCEVCWVLISVETACWSQNSIGTAAGFPVTRRARLFFPATRKPPNARNDAACGMPA